MTRMMETDITATASRATSAPSAYTAEGTEED